MAYIQLCKRCQTQVLSSRYCNPCKDIIIMEREDHIKELEKRFKEAEDILRQYSTAKWEPFSALRINGKPPSWTTSIGPEPAQDYFKEPNGGEG